MMTAKKNGDSAAFPCGDYYPGMTLREYLAAKAMQGLLAVGVSHELDAARYAVEAADALLNELAKENRS